MAPQLTQLTLPAFAFLEGSEHEKNLLEGRTVIVHVRSASIVEIFDRADVSLNDDVLRLKFTYTNRFGIKEQLVAALHYTATLNPISEAELIKKEILIPAAQWYCNYCAWEDENIYGTGPEQ